MCTIAFHEPRWRKYHGGTGSHNTLCTQAMMDRHKMNFCTNFTRKSLQAYCRIRKPNPSPSLTNRSHFQKSELIKLSKPELIPLSKIRTDHTFKNLS